MKTVKIKLPKMFYSIECCFPLKNDSYKTSEELDRLVGKMCTDSDDGFGEREMRWYFDNQRAATKAFNKLMHYKGLNWIKQVKEVR